LTFQVLPPSAEKACSNRQDDHRASSLRSSFFTALATLGSLAGDAS